MVYLDNMLKAHSSCFYLCVIVIYSNCRSYLCSLCIWSTVTAGLWVFLEQGMEEGREGEVGVFSQAGALGRRPKI